VNRLFYDEYYLPGPEWFGRIVKEALWDSHERKGACNHEATEFSGTSRRGA